MSDDQSSTSPGSLGSAVHLIDFGYRSGTGRAATAVSSDPHGPDLGRAREQAMMDALDAQGLGYDQLSHDFDADFPLWRVQTPEREQAIQHSLEVAGFVSDARDQQRTVAARLVAVSLGPVQDYAFRLHGWDWVNPVQLSLWLLDHIPAVRRRIRPVLYREVFNRVLPFSVGLMQPQTPILNNFFEPVTHVSTESGHFGSNRTDVPRNLDSDAPVP